MRTYNCEFPNCSYSSKNRSQIHEHHIVPRELGGNNKKNNKIYLCPNCHNKIFIPESKKGIHSKCYIDSIILKGRLKSTAGLVLEYIENDELKYHFY